MKKRNVFAIVFALFLILSLLCACNNTSGDRDSGGYPTDDVSDQTIVLTAGRKYVYRVRMTVKADNATATTNSFSRKAAELGGAVTYVDDDYDGYVCVYYSVPTDKLDEFVSYIENNSSVQSQNRNATELTTAYNHSTAEKTRLESDLEYYRAALAEVDTNDGLTASEKLEWKEKYREKIGSINEKLARYENADDVTAYSTVSLSVYDRTYGLAQNIFTIVVLSVFFGVPLCFGIYALVRLIVCKAKRVPFRLFGKLK